MTSVGDSGEQRRGVGRPRLPVDRIVETAVTILDAEGVGGLSMRTLAQRLNSSTATLYRHFPTRSALVDAVIDRVIGEIDLDAPEIRGGTWRQACRTIATELFRALERHRGVALLLADHTPVGPNAAMVRERWLAAMQRNGFPVDVAARSGALMSSYVQGFGIQLGGQRATAGLDDELLPAAMTMLDQTGFPATAKALGAGVLPVALEDEFTFGLDLILDGLGKLRGDHR